MNNENQSFCDKLMLIIFLHRVSVTALIFLSFLDGKFFFLLCQAEDGCLHQPAVAEAADHHGRNTGSAHELLGQILRKDCHLR